MKSLHCSIPFVGTVTCIFIYQLHVQYICCFVDNHFDHNYIYNIVIFFFFHAYKGDGSPSQGIYYFILFFAYYINAVI
jgi:hypothetical protein